MRIKTLFPPDGLQAMFVNPNVDPPYVIQPCYAATIVSINETDKTVTEQVEGLVNSSGGLWPASALPGFYCYIYNGVDVEPIVAHLLGMLHAELLDQNEEEETDDGSSETG